jgi:hypothetical protein
MSDNDDADPGQEQEWLRESDLINGGLIRRGHYELAVDERASRRVAVAFDELAMAI